MKPTRAAVEKNHGFAKPGFAGKNVGQTFSSEERVPTGKRFPIETPDRGTIWFPVVEIRTIHHWVWDGSAWLTAEEFDLTHARTCPPDTHFPSKRDVNALGDPAVRYVPKKLKKKARR